MGKTLHAALLTLLFGVAATTTVAQKIPKAGEIVKEAEAKAVDQNKAIFLVFGASWCDPCHQMDLFLATPEVAAIFSKYFVTEEVSVGEAAAGHPEWDNPGADTLMMKYGGIGSNGSASLPFIAILDQKAKLIANSNRPGKAGAADTGTGFPTEPQEIKWFLDMLEKAAPSMTAEETRTIQDALQKVAAE